MLHSILVVDDNSENIKVLGSILEQIGYEIRMATSGKEALNVIFTSKPDLILLDIMMPNMNGYEVCEKLKSDNTTKDIPVIFISALDEIENKIKAFRVGGVDYITKPFEKEEIIARVSTHIKLSQNKKNLIYLNKKLKEAQERFGLAIDGSNDGIWDWNVLTNEVYFSPRWKSMLGFSENELQNNLNTWSDRVHPDDLKLTLEILNKSLKEQTLYESIHRVKCKDGSYKWILDRGKFLFDKDGNPLRGVGFHTDITYIKELEGELKELNKNLENRVEREVKNRLNTELKYKYLFNNIDLGIVIHHFNEKKELLNFVEVNQKMIDMFGYNKDELLKLKLCDLHKKEKKDEMKNLITKISHSKSINFEDILITKSGKELNVEINSNIFTYNNRLTAFTTIKDITEKKRLQKEKNK